MIEKEILPLLRRQKGFLDELILLAPNKTEVVAISSVGEQATRRKLQPRVLSRSREDYQ